MGKLTEQHKLVPLEGLSRTGEFGTGIQDARSLLELWMGDLIL